MKRFLCPLLLTFLLTSCINVPSSPISRKYFGVLPAADCPGIKTFLELYTDATYMMELEYIDRFSAYRQVGTYTVEGNLITLISSLNDTVFFRVEDDSIRQLDMKCREIQGVLSDMYVLKAIDTVSTDIVGEWMSVHSGNTAPEVFELMHDGTVRSDNASGKKYSSWERIVDILYVKGCSLKGHQQAFVDTFSIVDCTSDSLVLVSPRSQLTKRFKRLR